MIRNLLYRLTDRMPCRIISDSDQPYLERYYVGSVLGWRFYLHQFVGSDPDRGVHDHPWRWAFAFLLAGHYLEQRRSGMRIVRWFNFITADTFHRVILHPYQPPVWTLFAHRIGDAKPWGFLTDPDADGMQSFRQHRYAKEGGKPVDWWLTAPTGKQVRVAK